jgi:8-oxo-dGTP diphosphatase
MIEVVCGVIRNLGGEYLACQRPIGKHLGGLWEFPGGKVDPGEAPEAALIRELREELAVDVETGDAMTPVVWTYGDRTIRLLPFRCRVVRGEPRAVEHAALRWCRPEDFHILHWAEADVPVLREIFPAFCEEFPKGSPN